MTLLLGFGWVVGALLLSALGNTGFVGGRGLGDLVEKENKKVREAFD